MKPQQKEFSPAEKKKLGIRSHNKTMPYRKPTAEELARRISRVEDLIRKIPLKSKLRKKIIALWSVHWTTADQYILRARGNLLIHLQNAKDQHRIDSLAFYEGIIANGDSTAQEKILARRQIDKLLGLHAPPETKPIDLNLHHDGSIAPAKDAVVIDFDKLDLATKKKLLAATTRVE